MSHKTRSILIGVIASFFFNPIGGIAIGLTNYYLCKED